MPTPYSLDESNQVPPADYKMYYTKYRPDGRRQKGQRSIRTRMVQLLLKKLFMLLILPLYNTHFLIGRKGNEKRTFKNNQLVHPFTCARIKYAPESLVDIH